MVFWYLLFLLAVLGLLAALVIGACRWTDEIVIHNKTIDQLQEQNKKLNKELQNAQTLKLQVKIEAAVVQKPIPQPVKPVQPNIPVGKESIAQAIIAKFGDSRVVTLAMCESGLNPTAFNPKDWDGTWDAGLFQVNQVHGYTPDYWFDINNNINEAWVLSNGGTNWAGWPVCRYQAGLI